MTLRRRLAGIEFSLAGEAVDSEWVVCLHGIGGDDTSFQPQLEALSRSYTVAAWNMPGYRQSDPLQEFSFESLAQTLRQWLDALQHRPVHLVGQSIGGMIAQEFAHRYPEFVRTLTLIATTSAFGGRDDSFRDAFLRARLKPLDSGLTMGELAARSIPEIVGTHAGEAVRQSAVEAMAGISEPVYRQVLQCLVTFDRRRELQQIACPVCLIAGSEDTNAPAVTMKKMAEKLRSVEYHEIQGAGHLVNLEMPEQTNQLIEHFLDRHGG